MTGTIDTLVIEDAAQDFIDALWSWLPAAPESERKIDCAICGAPVPESLATEDGFCFVCAVQ